MKILEQYPPNYDLIAAALKPTTDALYCYGDTVYNPSKRNITPDLEVHEAVHCFQQGDNIEEWYYNYLTDKQFRLAQEIDAYGTQYAFAKLLIRDKAILSWALEKMSQALSGEAYGNLLSYGQAESKIRNKAKQAAEELPSILHRPELRHLEERLT